MLKKIKRVFRVFRASLLVEEAWDLVARDKPEKAEKVFETAEQYLDKLPYEFIVIKGEIKFRLKKRAESLECYQMAWKQIQASRKLSDFDKKYLHLYMYSTIKLYREFLELKLDSLNIDSMDVREVDLQKVSKTWKKRFPYRNHPDWDKYGI